MINNIDCDAANFMSISQDNPRQLYFVIFKATWCSPCKTIYPSIVEFSNNYPSIKFYVCDLDNDDDQYSESIINYFQPAKVPSFYYIKNGEIIDSIIGTNLSKIEDLLNQYL